eukprot:984497-Amphidinium_carterae.1
MTLTTDSTMYPCMSLQWRCVKVSSTSTPQPQHSQHPSSAGFRRAHAHSGAEKGFMLHNSQKQGSSRLAGLPLWIHLQRRALPMKRMEGSPLHLSLSCYPHNRAALTMSHGKSCTLSSRLG